MNSYFGSSSLLRGYDFFITAVVMFFSLAFHEFAHAYVANFFGDPTARNMGRLSLNPLRHLNLFGTVSLFVFGFGWANPVPVNINNFYKPKKHMSFVAVAGPVSNLFLAFMFGIMFKLLDIKNMYSHFKQPNLDLYYLLRSCFSFGFHLNIGLFVFNLLPIPPLDGSRLFTYFLPDNIYYTLMKYESFGSLLLIYLFYTRILTGPLTFGINLCIKMFSFIFGDISIIS